MKKISVCKARCDIHNLFGLSGLLQTVKAICSCKNSATLPVAPALKTWPNFQSKTQQDLARLDISRLKRNLSGIAWRLLSLSRTCHKGFDPMARFSCLDVAWCCMTSLSPHRAFLRLWTAEIEQLGWTHLNANELRFLDGGNAAWELKNWTTWQAPLWSDFFLGKVNLARTIFEQASNNRSTCINFPPGCFFTKRFFSFSSAVIEVRVSWLRSG